MRRGPYDIEADILRVAAGGAKKTQLVYKANLNFKIVKRYLSRLIKRGYLVNEEGGRGSFYHTTELGHEYLRRYGLLQDLNQVHPTLAV